MLEDSMSERDNGGELLEDDGVLGPADSLDDDDLRADVLDTGIDAGDRYRAATRFGTTAEEGLRGESLDELLAEEEPDDGPDVPWTDEDEPSDEEGRRSRRAGRLVAPDAGAHADEDATAFAFDVGIDGGGAGAEEAAVYIIDE
jgi:Family of unknown function (DUF5709)